MPHMSTFAAVVRVSHMGKRKVGDEKFHADREQLDPIEAWAKAEHVKLDVLPPELDVSGGLPLEQRPSLLRAIEGVERGEYAGIVVAYLSRFGRSTLEQLKAWQRVEDAGGRVVVVRENIDTSTASGRLQRDLLLGIATHEREQHAERFEERRRLATQAGIWQRRQTPRGYRRDEATRRLVPDRRAGQVRAAFRDFLSGTSITELTRRLDMTHSGVRQMLGNRVYLGELRVGQHVNRSAHEPLIDLATFEATHAALSSNARPPRGRHEGPALLAGIVRCASCGHRMTRSASGARAVYACPRQHSGVACPRPAAVTLALLDAHVEPIALAELARLQVSASEGQQVERAHEALAVAERELAAYMSAVSADDVGQDAFRTAALERHERIDGAREQLRLALASQPMLPKTGSGTDVWEELDAHERNSLLRALLGAVVVEPSGRGRRVPLEHRVRVLAHGADLVVPKRRGGEASGIVPIPLPDVDDPAVLRVPLVEDRPKRLRRARKVRRRRPTVLAA